MNCCHLHCKIHGRHFQRSEVGLQVEQRSTGYRITPKDAKAEFEKERTRLSLTSYDNTDGNFYYVLSIARPAMMEARKK